MWSGSDGGSGGVLCTYVILHHVVDVVSCCSWSLVVVCSLLLRQQNKKWASQLRLNFIFPSHYLRDSGRERERKEMKKRDEEEGKMMQ